MKQIIFLLFLALFLKGCIVGSIVSASFEITGSFLNTVTPDIVGDTVSGTGEVLDAVIPF